MRAAQRTLLRQGIARFPAEPGNRRSPRQREVRRRRARTDAPEEGDGRSEAAHDQVARKRYHGERRPPGRLFFSFFARSKVQSALKMRMPMSNAALTPAHKANVLAEALPYIKRFHGKTIVVKYGGNAMTEELLKRSFAHDVGLLKLVGMNPGIGHGGGPPIDEQPARMGKKGEFVQGLRGTDAETTGLVGRVLGRPVNKGRGEPINPPGVLDKNNKLLTGLTPKKIDALVADGTLSGGMLPKISSALDAARNGVKSVHIIDGRVEHALLLEILTDEGVGTLIRSK